MPDNKLPDFDVIILGAGPAGLCAALRLLDLGYIVAIVEQRDFPRAQIGESLSPGIRNIFAYLGLAHLLERPEYLQSLPATIIWSQQEAVYQSGNEKQGVIVDRSTLDSDVLAAAKAKGAYVLQPAAVRSMDRSGDNWHLRVCVKEKEVALTTRIVLDARGRKSVLKRERIETAAPMVAIWTHVPAAYMPKETRVEAIANGWFWGSPLPNGTYRILLFVDPEAVKKDPAALVFENGLRASALFSELPLHNLPHEIATCSVLSYVHANPWNENYIRIGEAAFALDPLSSTGVEKAMRFSLQTVIAVNTLLKTNNTALAKTFYEEKLIEAVLTHKRWTEAFYRQNWAYSSDPFWQNRSHKALTGPVSGAGFFEKLMQHHSLPVHEPVGKEMGSINVDMTLIYLAKYRVCLCDKTIYRYAFAIADEIVEIKEAVHHPNLKQDTVFLDGVALKPLLAGITNEMTFEELLLAWAGTHSMGKARKLIAFLWSHELLKAG